jgi:acetyl esterase/lipase
MKTTTAFFVTALSILSITPLPAQQAKSEPSAPVLLWPEGKMPGKPAAHPESELPPRGDNVQRITQVSNPTIKIFQAPGAIQPTPAVIVCPGGAYGIVAYNIEGTEIATWLNSIGITGIVLKYRVPNNRDGALQDIQRAMRLVRANAVKWNINPDRIGTIGFSAGGHLCARFSTDSEQNSYPKLDSIDDLSSRPNFTLLVYPAFLAHNGQLAPELHVGPHIPPTFIAQTDDDASFVPGTKIYQAALESAKVPNKFFLCPKGGHGYGIRLKPEQEISAWPQKCQEWLKTIGML